MKLKILGTLLLSLSCVANATLIDFEDLGVLAGTQLNPANGIGIISGGFSFDPTASRDLHVHNQNGIGNNGSTHLGAHDEIAMSAGGAIFSIQSFDFAGFITESNISVVGQLFGGGSIQTTFISDLNTSTYETFNFSSSWVNLTGVSFEYLGLASNGFFIDDIEVNGSRIPEPSTLAIFALGMIGLASRRFKKQS